MQRRPPLRLLFLLSQILQQHRHLLGAERDHTKTFVVVYIVRLPQSLRLKGYTLVFEIVLALNLFMLTGWRRDLGSARNEGL